MNFDYGCYPFNSHRNVVFSKNGMVACGSPLAAQAGANILKNGGNAIDAAIAAAAAHTVVEPTCNGLGSDMFAIIWHEGKLYGLNASGRSPKSISIDEVKKRGHEEIPIRGIIPINTPGAVGGWAKCHSRFGKMDFIELFKDAIDYAENGFPVSPTVSKLWRRAYSEFEIYRDKKEFEPWFSTFAKENRAPNPGEIFKNKDLAETLKSIAKSYTESFYHGHLAEEISDYMKSVGGFLSFEDLENYSPMWVDPVSINYRGVDVWELPPNGHGITVLMALGILKEFEFKHKFDVETIHRQIEAMKLSMVDTKKYVTDPEKMSIDFKKLLTEEYFDERRKMIGEFARVPVPSNIDSHSTVYFATADRDGNMVSMIQSNYMEYGSGIVVPNTGIALNNRGCNFSMDKNHDNCLEGGKLPYHTIIPGFLTKDGEAFGAFGVMGGFMQPQGHLQVLMNMLDFGFNPQAALDAPRFMWFGENKVRVEQDMPNHILRQLEERGHELQIVADSYEMGRGQIILRNSDGVYAAGTEKRTDGFIAIC